MKNFISKILLVLSISILLPTSPVSAKTNSSSTAFFENVELSESLPKTFYKNEVYLVEGTTDFKKNDTISAVLEPKNQVSKENITFTSTITDGKFSIPVFFSEQGDFHMGIVLGDEGSSRAATIKVSSIIPLASGTETPPEISTPKIDYANNQTTVEISTSIPSFKKITFVQQRERVVYLSRQNTNSIPINYSDFKNFREGKIYFYAEAAQMADSQNTISLNSPYAKTRFQSFNGTTHAFSEIRTQEITANPPSKLNKIGPISFSGIVKTDTAFKADIIKPDGFTETIDLKIRSKTDKYGSKTIIKEGSNYEFTYVPATEGRYILEISNKEGLPIVNHATYVGSAIPIIPDFFDLNKRKLSKTTPPNVEILRKSLLNEINKSRVLHGLTRVQMDSELNNLAQAHSEDMAKNRYFSHNNLQSQSPEGRRIAAGIKTPVAENIAKDVSIKFAHEGLMRSATHRGNILEKDWTRVGLGITKKNGYFYVTQEFSTSPLTNEDLETNKNELLNQINALRKSKKLKELKYSPSLELVAKELNEDSINNGATLTTSSLSKVLDEFGIDGNTLAIGRNYISWNPILQSILDSESKITESKWKTIGIDIQLDKTGNINMLIIINRA